MVWLMIGALGLMVLLLAGQAVLVASLRMRVAECEEILNESLDLRDTADTRRAYVKSRVRMYVARWGKITIEEAV